MTNNLRQHFEANMLDGDSLDDCGNAMLSAKEVFEYLEERVAEARKTHTDSVDAELRDVIEGDFRRYLELALTPLFNVCKVEQGERDRLFNAILTANMISVDSYAMQLLTQARKEPEQPYCHAATLKDPEREVRCDRAKGHGGKHSWELVTELAQARKEEHQHDYEITQCDEDCKCNLLHLFCNDCDFTATLNGWPGCNEARKGYVPEGEIKGGAYTNPEQYRQLRERIDNIITGRADGVMTIDEKLEALITVVKQAYEKGLRHQKIYCMGLHVTQAELDQKVAEALNTVLGAGPKDYVQGQRYLPLFKKGFNTSNGKWREAIAAFLTNPQKHKQEPEV